MLNRPNIHPASMQELVKGREILKAKKDSACYIAYPDYIVGVR